MRQEHSELFVANVVEHLWQRKIILWLQCPQLTFWDTRDTKKHFVYKAQNMLWNTKRFDFSVRSRLWDTRDTKPLECTVWNTLCKTHGRETKPYYLTVTSLWQVVVHPWDTKHFWQQHQTLWGISSIHTPYINVQCLWYAIICDAFAFVSELCFVGRRFCS